MSDILVTGAAGFIGSHLTRELLHSGHRVFALDNLATGNWSNLPEHPNLIRCQQEVEQPWDQPVQQIFHLACPASPTKYQKDPLKTLDTNYLGTRNVLELARKHQARLLFTSTSEIYGDPLQSPQSESYWGNVNCYGPRSCYDEGKRIGEALCYTYRHQFQVEVRIARIFNTYGPQMAADDGRVVTNFIHQALTGEAITLYGDGSQTRSLCYVDDLVAGLLALMASQLVDPVNLGNPHEMTVREIAQLILELTGSQSQLVEHPLPLDDPQRRRPDIQRAQSLLNWSPKVSVRDGLSMTCNYFRNLLTRTK
jgi:UDP-glucuronate decarboxylase